MKKFFVIMIALLGLIIFFPSCSGEKEEKQVMCTENNQLSKFDSLLKSESANMELIASVVDSLMFANTDSALLFFNRNIGRMKTWAVTREGKKIHPEADLGYWQKALWQDYRPFWGFEEDGFVYFVQTRKALSPEYQKAGDGGIASVKMRVCRNAVREKVNL